MPENAPIPELIGQTITKAEYIDGGVWFDVEITTADGHVIRSGGYKSDATASLDAPDGTTIRESNW